MVNAQQQDDEQAAYAVAANVSDPELPFITIEELGILRAVERRGDTMVAKVAPTYLGCPAVKVIEQAVIDALVDAGYKAEVETQLSPAWTTEWITKAGRQKLESHGIAMEQPVAPAGLIPLFAEAPPVACPQCGVTNTKMISRFGSTPCKAQYQCNGCAEPFELFKCH